MKQVEVFEGLIDGQKFDDPVKFKEYLEEHKDAKNVSYSHSIREVADEQEKAEEKARLTEKEADNLYPPCLDIDEYLDKDDADQLVEDACNEYLEKHEQLLEKMNSEELDKHYNKLQNLRKQVKGMLKVNSQATEKLSCEIEELNKQIEERQERLESLLLSEDLLSMNYTTLKEAIVDTDKYRDHAKDMKKSDKKEEIKKSPLEDLLNCLYLFC